MILFNRLFIYVLMCILHQMKMLTVTLLATLAVLQSSGHSIEKRQGICIYISYFNDNSEYNSIPINIGNDAHLV